MQDARDHPSLRGVVFDENELHLAGLRSEYGGNS
jgi:hypothetical protein